MLFSHDPDRFALQHPESTSKDPSRMNLSKNTQSACEQLLIRSETP